MRMPTRGFVVLLLAMMASLSWAAALVPQAPKLAANAYVLMDADTGHIIVENNADEVLAPASLTKMMTAYILAYEVATGNVSLADEVRISEKAWRTEGSRMFIQEGKFVLLEDLMRGVIIQSGNDASVAVAEHLAGSEEAFADLMNQHADRLDMTNTRFHNATGLPAEGHLTTARDLAILAQAIINDYPDHYKVYSEKEFTFNKIRQPNRNKLLWRDSTVDGLKTGHTQAAGYCLVASAKKDGQRLISVLLGAKSTESRAQESQKLLTYGMRFFESHTLYDAGEKLQRVRVWGGESDYINLVLADAMYVTVPRGQAKNLQASIEINPEIEAPVVAQQTLGSLQVSLDGEIIAQQALVAESAIADGGFIKSTTDGVVKFFQGVLD
ncbi:MAG: D-alanyl-D-alanine carboxypeptidase [Gammaproteobacteria bacterium]|nr:D-alanyl-D-alanine carboxypeptidase [Gammaproteobacteria bacterium]